jgi:hypothetical protein
MLSQLIMEWMEIKGEVKPGLLGEDELVTKLRAFYTKHNPQNLHNIFSLAETIRNGGEDAVHETLIQKYGAIIWNRPRKSKPQDPPLTPPSWLEICIVVFILVFGIIFGVRFVRYLLGLGSSLLGMIGCLMDPWCSL